jgi:transcription elongation factor
MFIKLAEIICHKSNNFISFAIHDELLRKIVYEVSMLDLDEPPKNKLRKVIFKPNTLISKEEKLRIVGELIGRSKRITEDDIYSCMLEINNNNEKITIAKLAKLLKCASRTIHRNMCEQLKREKELLNKQL